MSEYLALDLIAAHFVGDYILQTHWMAMNKFKDWRVRFVHVSAYLLPFVWVALLHGSSDTRQIWFLLAVGVAHFITDSRQWSPKDHPWPAKALAVDQSMHLVQLAVFARLL